MGGRRRPLLLATAAALAVLVSGGSARAASQAVPADSTPITISYSGSSELRNTALPQKSPSSYVERSTWRYTWSGTWGQLFADKSVYTSRRLAFTGVSLTIRYDVVYKEKSDGPALSCTVTMRADPAAPAAFFASFDPSAETLQVTPYAPGLKVASKSSSEMGCLGGAGGNVLSAPADYVTLPTGGTFDIEKGGTVGVDRTWKWTHVYTADLDKAHRDYEASLRSELTVGSPGCTVAAASAACGPRVSSLTYVNVLWDTTPGAGEFVNGAALVADRREMSPLRVDQASPVGCTDDRLAVWLDCNGDGTSDKSWPVAFVRGTRPPLAEVRFRQGPGCRRLGALTVVGRASLPGGSVLRFERTGFKPSGCGEMRVGGFSVLGRMPNDVRTWRLRIAWTLVERSGRRHAAGTTDTQAYTLLATPTEYRAVTSRPVAGDGGLGWSQQESSVASRPFLSLIDLAATEAAGARTPEGVVSGSFRPFKGLRVRPRRLDIATGAVRTDAPMFYWARGDVWTLPKLLLQIYQSPTQTLCAADNVLLLLTQGRSTGGRCGSWGPLFGSLLALQGITQILVEDPPAHGAAWNAVTPPRAKGCTRTEVVLEMCWMLVDPWRFASGPPPHRYRIELGPRPRVLEERLWYLLPKEGESRGQGPQASPPGMFELGDHVIVRALGRIYDPSYGIDYDNVGAWVDGSIAAWATLRCKGETCTLEAWPLRS